MSLRFSSMLAGLAVTAMLLAAGSAPAAGLDMLSITAPADMTVTADAVCGQSNCAQVVYTFTVTGGYPPYHQVCTPVDSGSYFLVGTHVVSCLAQDSEGNSTPYASFTLTVLPGGPPPPPPPPPPAMLSITAPADMTVTASAVCGQSNCAQVFYTFTVAGGYPPYHEVCTPVDSGSYFLVGTHTVSCLAQDSEGNSTPYSSFTLTVNPPSTGGGSGGGGGNGGGGNGGAPAPGASPNPTPSTQDTTAPVIAPHANITIPAETPAGAPLTYSVIASDPDDTGAQVTVACQPASGSNFRLRPDGTTETTTVTCDAHDRAGNNAKQRSFTVTVVGAHAQIVVLERLLTTARLPGTEERGALVATLARANRSLNTRDLAGARSLLRSFIAQIRRHPGLSAHETALLISTATRIEHVIA